MSRLQFMNILFLLFLAMSSECAALPQYRDSEMDFTAWQLGLEEGVFVKGDLIQITSGVGAGGQGRMEYVGGFGPLAVFEWIRSSRAPSSNPSSGHGFGFCQIFDESEFVGEWQCLGLLGLERLQNQRLAHSPNVIARDVSCSAIRFLPAGVDLCTLAEGDLIGKSEMESLRLLKDPALPSTESQYYWARKNGKKHAVVQVWTTGQFLGSWNIWLGVKDHWALLGGGILDWGVSENGRFSKMAKSFETFDSPRHEAYMLSRFEFEEFRAGGNAGLDFFAWAGVESTPVADGFASPAKIGMIYDGRVLWHTGKGMGVEEKREWGRWIGFVLLFSSLYYWRRASQKEKAS